MAVILGIWLVLTVSTTNTAAFCVIGINKPNSCFWPLKLKFIDTTNQHKYGIFLMWVQMELFLILYKYR